MTAPADKLVLVLSCDAGSERAKHAAGLIEAGIRRGIPIKIYLIDDGVGLVPMLQKAEWNVSGVRVFGCAYGARLRGIPLADEVTWGGLGLLSDLIATGDQVLSL